MGRYILYGLAWLTVASAAGSDTVRLANGHRIEDVVARSGSGEVTILFSYGEMSLPASMVLAVEKSESALERYLAQSAALAADLETTAAHWFALARVARADGLEDGHRRALLKAAVLEPQWPPLAAALRELNYVLDPSRGGWVPYEQSAAALALAAEREARRRTAAAAEAEQARNSRRDRLLESLELALLAQVVEDLTESGPEPAPPNGIPLWGPYVQPLVIRTSPGFGPVEGGLDTERNRATWRDLSRRQPGSLLPVSPRSRPAARHNHSSIENPGSG